MAVKAAMAVVLVMLLASCAEDKGALGAKDSATGEWAASIELLPAVGHVVDALQRERAAGVLDSGIEADETARARTDAAVVTFEGLVVDDRAARDYREAVEVLGGLDAIRSRVDDDSTAADIARDYGAVVTTLTGANRFAAARFDDPEVRRGAELYAEGLAQTEVSASLTFVVVDGVDPDTRNSSTWVRSASALITEFDRGWSFIEDIAARSRYGSLADALHDDLRIAGYFDTVPQLVDGEEFDVAAMAQAVALPHDRGWWPFLAGVERMLRQGD